MSDVPLKEYIERITAERDKAIEIATRGLEKRLELLNELRGDVVSRSEYDRSRESLDVRLRVVESNGVRIAVIVSAGTSIVIGVVVGLILHFFK